MRQDTSFLGFTGRMIVAHFLTYFLMGLIFYFTGLNVLVYYEQHPLPLVNDFFRESSSLLVTVGPLFQLLRGLIFAIALYPFRSVILERKRGWLYLWGLFLALAILAPSGSSPGSIEGFVYTTFPLTFHLIYLPEIILQTLAFAWLFVFWENRRGRWLTVSLVVISALILLTNAFPIVLTLTGGM